MRPVQSSPLHSSTRRAALHLVVAGLVAGPMAPLPAHPATIQSVVTTLDETEVHQPAQGVHAIEVAVGAPNSDSWCAVAVTAPRDVEYLWLKDASTATTRKVYGARYFAAQSSASPRQHPAVLQQQLKVGYRAKPFSYSKENGLYEGETFIVR